MAFLMAMHARSLALLHMIENSWSIPSPLRAWHQKSLQKTALKSRVTVISYHPQKQQNWWNVKVACFCTSHVRVRKGNGDKREIHCVNRARGGRGWSMRCARRVQAQQLAPPPRARLTGKKAETNRSTARAAPVAEYERDTRTCVPLRHSDAWLLLLTQAAVSSVSCPGVRPVRDLLPAASRRSRSRGVGFAGFIATPPACAACSHGWRGFFRSRSGDPARAPWLASGDARSFRDAHRSACVRAIQMDRRIGRSIRMCWCVQNSKGASDADTASPVSRRWHTHMAPSPSLCFLTEKQRNRRQRCICVSFFYLAAGHEGITCGLSISLGAYSRRFHVRVRKCCNHCYCEVKREARRRQRRHVRSWVLTYASSPFLSEWTFDGVYVSHINDILMALMVRQISHHV